MKSTSSKTPVTYVRRLGRHHFAYLRAVAEGIDIQVGAKCFLGIEHGLQAITAHQQTMLEVRAVARRHKQSAWRLIGLHINVAGGSARPSLEEYIDLRRRDGVDLSDFSEQDILEWYQEAFPVDRKAGRRRNLRERQMALIAELEKLAAEIPRPEDMVSGWFDDVTSKKLISAGVVNLSDLAAKVATGGRWYSALPGVGSTKANRIAAHLDTLLPHLSKPKKAQFTLVEINDAIWRNASSDSPSVDLVFRQAPSPPLPSAMLSATSDQEAVEAWVKARAGSEATAISYRREALRLMLWLQHEAGNKTFRYMDVDDCGDYMAFLQDIPTKWISRARAKPTEEGWAPFRGPLSHKSQRQAIVIVVALFTWLHAAKYLAANPWVLMNQKTGDDREQKMLDTKALSEGAMSEVLRFIEAQPPSPSRSRIRFILLFVESVGLRSAELLNAYLKDLSLQPEGWVIQVHGKGAKNRVAAVPGQAFNALQEYLLQRGIGGIETAPSDAPLLAKVKNAMEPIGYHALYVHVRDWLQKAIRASALPLHEREKLHGASTHWLRHTFGTRAIAREVPLDVIQAQMGHASIQTTTAIYGRAPIKRRVDELGKAFG